MRRFMQSSVCLLVVLGLTADLAATTARRLTNRDLAETAEAIAIGTVSGVRTAWEGRMLVTVATVTVRETLKGSIGGTISVALPGGIDANRRFPVAMTYAGAPTMKPGEEVFLFLAQDEAVTSGFTVLGFSQGKFSIVQDASGRQLVSRDLTTLNLQTGTGIVPGTLTLASLSEFRQEILSYVQ